MHLERFLPEDEKIYKLKNTTCTCLQYICNSNLWLLVSQSVFHLMKNFFYRMHPSAGDNYPERLPQTSQDDKAINLHITPCMFRFGPEGIKMLSSPE